jgi:capsular exopolysaccharide synthesis family protein
MILAVMILATTASGLLSWRETPQYASQVTLFVSAWSSPDDAVSAYQGSLLSQQKVKSYAELVQGHRVMSGVIDRLQLDLTPSQLAGRVSSAVVPDTSLLTATVRDPSPQRAQRIAEAIGYEFVELIPALESVAADQRPPVKLTVVGPAELPAAPVSPRPIRNGMLALVVGALLGFGLAVARRALDTTIKSPELAEEIGGAPVLGRVPQDRAAPTGPLIGAAGHGPQAEAFRKVRTNLQFADVDRPHQAILVTSAAPEEGKSVTACNLAITIAEAGKRVVLIDGDLRRRSVAGYLGLPNGVGLTSVLLGRASLPEAVQPWGGELFTALTSGPLPPNPTTLLASQRLRDLVEELRASYDVVVVDSPPVLPVADAALLATACDGVVVVVRHGSTRRDQLRTTMRTLANTGVPVLGTLLNQTPRARGSYYEYSGQSSLEPAGRPPEPAPVAAR